MPSTGQHINNSYMNKGWEGGKFLEQSFLALHKGTGVHRWLGNGQLVELATDLATGTCNLKEMDSLAID